MCHTFLDTGDGITESVIEPLMAGVLRLGGSVAIVVEQVLHDPTERIQVGHPFVVLSEQFVLLFCFIHLTRSGRIHASNIMTLVVAIVGLDSSRLAVAERTGGVQDARSEMKGPALPQHRTTSSALTVHVVMDVVLLIFLATLLLCAAALFVLAVLLLLLLPFLLLLATMVMVPVQNAALLRTVRTLPVIVEVVFVIRLTALMQRKGR